MALLSEHIPEDDRAAGERPVAEAEVLQALVEFGRASSGLADAGEIAFDIGSKNGHSDAAHRFGHDLQGYGLPGSCCTCDQAMAVRHCRKKRQFLCSLCDYRHVNHWESLHLPRSAIQSRCGAESRRKLPIRSSLNINSSPVRYTSPLNPEPISSPANASQSCRSKGSSVTFICIDIVQLHGSGRVPVQDDEQKCVARIVRARSSIALVAELEAIEQGE